MSCEHQHTHGHDHDNDHNGHDHSHIAPDPTNQAQSLRSKIDLHHITGLNVANPPEQLAKIFRPADHMYNIDPVIKSDCGSQTIINIPFLNSSAKLFSILLRTNGDNYCPRTIKLFKNDPQIDFDNVDQKRPAHTLNHPRVGVAADLEVSQQSSDNNDFVEHYLPRHVFTGVHLLTVFVKDVYDEENEEDEDDAQSRIHYIDLRGEYTELTKEPVITLYESAANPADHKSLTATAYELN